jgi:hypothetical protein
MCEEEYYDTTFEDCTCDHEPEEHGWGECNIEGCDCEGGWTG